MDMKVQFDMAILANNTLILNITTPLRFKPGKVCHDNGEDERESASIDAIEAWLLGSWLGSLGWDGT